MKGEDYKDWVLINNMMVKGLHRLPEGKSYIEAVKSRMNNARLSTNLNNPAYQILPLPSIDPFNLPTVYELTD